MAPRGRVLCVFAAIDVKLCVLRGDISNGAFRCKCRGVLKNAVGTLPSEPSQL